VVVHGRFHAFDLARALIARGLDVMVLTSYPYWVAARWGIPNRRLRTFPLHGVLGRIGGRIRRGFPWPDEAFLHELFSGWAVRQLRREPWDVIYSFSGISEDIEREPSLAGALRMVVRGSAHIRRQAQILVREEERVCQKLDRPSQWMIEREQREYQMADRIVVLSTFAYQSFREEGIPETKLSILPLGSESRAFRPDASVIAARRARILSGGPLTIVYAGNVSFQKGAFDMAEIIRKASGRSFRFRLAGVVMPEAKKIAEELRAKAEFLGRLPQAELPGFYATGDIFLFPTLQDGFAVVLAQASAAGLPILTTANCCGPDLVHEGQTGWVLPIRDPEAFLDRLNWCESHRRELAAMVTAAYEEFRTRDWSDVAADFESLCRTEIAVRGKQHGHGGLQPNQLLEEVRNQSS
jgi:glycosyltransferase involved in cell wall biosynthesis